MKIDADKLLKSLEKRRKRGKTIAFYMDGELWKEFQQACGIIPPSRVLEQFIREFLESKKKKK